MKNFAKIWAVEAEALVEKLERGETAWFNPLGRSMEPHIKSGQQVMVTPVDPMALNIDDIVLVKVKQTYYVHFIIGVREDSFSIFSWQIGNAKGGVNGWVNAEHIFGKVTPIPTWLA